MKYITMPKITAEQHQSFIEQLEQFPEMVFKEHIDWLLKGTARTVTRKGNAQDLLAKFVSKSDSVSNLCRVHDTNGTKLACNGVLGAVILPDGAEKWDMNDAYIPQKNGGRWTALQESLREARTKIRSTASVRSLQELLAACIGRCEEYRGTPRSERGRCPKISVNAETMDVVSDNQAANMHLLSHGRPICVDASNLELALKFILCANAETEVYYSDWLSPIYFQAGNLYTVLVPLRAAWTNPSAQKKVS